MFLFSWTLPVGDSHLTHLLDHTPLEVPTLIFRISQKNSRCSDPCTVIHSVFITPLKKSQGKWPIAKS